MIENLPDRFRIRLWPLHVERTDNQIEKSGQIKISQNRMDRTCPIGGYGQMVSAVQQRQYVPERGFLFHEGNEPVIREIFSMLMSLLQPGIVTEKIVDALPRSTHVHHISFIRLHCGLIEMTENGVIKSDIGFAGIE